MRKRVDRVKHEKAQGRARPWAPAPQGPGSVMGRTQGVHWKRGLPLSLRLHFWTLTAL